MEEEEEMPRVGQSREEGAVPAPRKIATVIEMQCSVEQASGCGSDGPPLLLHNTASFTSSQTAYKERGLEPVTCVKVKWSGIFLFSILNALLLSWMIDPVRDSPRRRALSDTVRLLAAALT